MFKEWVELFVVSGASFFNIYILLFMVMERLQEYAILKSMTTGLGYITVFISGFIGMAVRDVACILGGLIFGYGVESFSAFRPAAGGVLGKISTYYTQAEAYSPIKEFVIEIMTPVLLSSVILILFFYICMPKRSKVFFETKFVQDGKSTVLDQILTMIKEIFMMMKKLLAVFFKNRSLRKPGTWIFFFVTYSICSQIYLVPIEYNHLPVVVGIIFLILAALCLVLVILKKPVKIYRSMLIKYNAFIFSISILTAGISVMVILISCVARLRTY